MATTLLIENGELAIDNRGRCVEITSLGKVAQEVLGALLTRFDPPIVNAGSDFSNVVDRYAAATRIVDYVRTELHTAIDRLRRLQESQTPALPDDEIISAIKDITIDTPSIGMIDLFFRVAVRSGQVISISKRLILNSVALNQLDSGSTEGLVVSQNGETVIG